MHVFLILMVAGQLAGSTGPLTRSECESVKDKTVVVQAFRSQVSLKCESRDTQPDRE